MNSIVLLNSKLIIYVILAIDFAIYILTSCIDINDKCGLKNGTLFVSIVSIIYMASLAFV